MKKKDIESRYREITNFAVGEIEREGTDRVVKEHMAMFIEGAKAMREACLEPDADAAKVANRHLCGGIAASVVMSMCDAIDKREAEIGAKAAE